MDEINNEIVRLKKQMGSELCILGHHYQHDSVARHCDIMGDSLELARKIKDIDSPNIVFCGVYFMGETAALLAAENQKIYLPEPDADCMMALMANAKMARNVLRELVSTGRKIIPLAYVNTMLELKDVVGEFGGAVCTSANAREMLKWALDKGDSVLFLPDKQLGQNTANLLGIPDSDQYILRITGKGLKKGQEEDLNKKLLLWPGGCAIHAKFRQPLLEKIKRETPDAHIIVHPECRPEIVKNSHAAGSTSFIIKEVERLAREQVNSSIIIGTEENLVHRLATLYKGKLNIKAFGKAICPHMAQVTPEKLLSTLRKIKNNSASEVIIKSEIRKNARSAIMRMLDVMNTGSTR